MRNNFLGSDHWLGLAMVVGFLIGQGCSPATEGEHFIRVAMQIGQARVLVEVANEENARRRGLMYRQQLGTDEGMLFVYEKDDFLSFWMKNTFVPLSVAFIRDDGTISQITDMETADGRPDFLLPSYKSREKVRYAVEMKQGWFRERGISEGTQVILPASLRKK